MPKRNVSPICADKPIYKIILAHTTATGVLHPENQYVWVFEYNITPNSIHHPARKEPYSRVSVFNRQTGLPKNTTFIIPTRKLERVTK